MGGCRVCSWGQAKTAGMGQVRVLWGPTVRWKSHLYLPFMKVMASLVLVVSLYLCSRFKLLFSEITLQNGSAMLQLDLKTLFRILSPKFIKNLQNSTPTPPPQNNPIKKMDKGPE